MRLRPALALVLSAVPLRAAVIAEPVRVTVGAPAFGAALAPSFAPAVAPALGLGLAPSLAGPSLAAAPVLAAAPALMPAAAPAPSLPLVAAIAIALGGRGPESAAVPAAKPAMSSSRGSSEEAAVRAAAEFDGASLADFGVGPDRALAPDPETLGAKARALFRLYLPSLDRDFPVKWELEDSMLGSGGGHEFDPATGHRVTLTPGEADARGIVPSSIGERSKARVQSKMDQILTAVHEYAHAVFDEAVARKIGPRPAETAYDAMTEGFAVTVERLVLAGMIRDAGPLGLSARDAADARALIETRARWLAEEDETAYAEGVAVWEKVRASGGEAGMAAFLSSLSAERMTAVRRADAAYQLSLGSKETAAAHLGGGGPLAEGLAAAADAAAGKPLDPARRAAAAAAIDAAGPDGWSWLARRALTREHDFGDDGETLWIVPVFLRHGEDLAEALFRLTPLSRGLAETAARVLSAAAASPDGVARVFEEPGPTKRLATLAAGAETLPWAAAAKAAWDAALTAWILPSA